MCGAEARLRLRSEISCSVLPPPSTSAARCSVCGDAGENWMDIDDGFVGCSRHVHGHAALHATATGDSIYVSLSDLSVWCYACDSYITSPVMTPLLHRLSNSKHNLLPLSPTPFTLPPVDLPQYVQVSTSPPVPRLLTKHRGWRRGRMHKGGWEVAKRCRRFTEND